MIAETKLLCWADMMPPTQHLMSLSYIHVHWRNTCTYACTHVLYIGMYTCTVHRYVHMYCTYACTHVLNIGMYTCTVHTYVCVYTYTYVRTCTQVCMYVCTHVHTCMSQVRSIVHWCLYCMGCVCTCNSLLFLSSWRVIRLCQL